LRRESCQACCDGTSPGAEIKNYLATARQTIFGSISNLSSVADSSNVFTERSPMSKSQAKSTPMTSQAAARIQSVTAKTNGGQVKASSFAAVAQRAAAVNQGGATKGSK
jgi:hypothetical protein